MAVAHHLFRSFDLSPARSGPSASPGDCCRDMKGTPGAPPLPPMPPALMQAATAAVSLASPVTQSRASLYRAPSSTPSRNSNAEPVAQGTSANRQRSLEGAGPVPPLPSPQHLAALPYPPPRRSPGPRSPGRLASAALRADLSPSPMEGLSTCPASPLPLRGSPNAGEESVALGDMSSIMLGTRRDGRFVATPMGLGTLRFERVAGQGKELPSLPLPPPPPGRLRATCSLSPRPSLALRATAGPLFRRAGDQSPEPSQMLFARHCSVPSTCRGSTPAPSPPPRQPRAASRSCAPSVTGSEVASVASHRPESLVPAIRLDSSVVAALPTAALSDAWSSRGDRLALPAGGRKDAPLQVPLSCISTTVSNVSLRPSSTIISAGSAGSRSPRWLPPRVEDEDLIEQHVRYWLRHHPQEARGHIVTRVSRGVYNIDGHEVEVEWQHHPIVGMPGHLVVVDGPMRQPFSDYITMNEANCEYDTLAVAKTSALHHVPKERRMTFDDGEDRYTRLEAMKVAKEQANIREQAADYAREGLLAPDELVKKYNKNLRTKLGRNKVPGPRGTDENRDPQVNREARVGKSPDEAVAWSPEPAAQSPLMASPQQALSPLPPRARLAPAGSPVVATSWAPSTQASFIPQSSPTLTTPAGTTKVTQVWSYCGSPVLSGVSAAGAPSYVPAPAAATTAPSYSPAAATVVVAAPSYVPSAVGSATGGGSAATAAAGSTAGSMQGTYSTASYTPGYARFVALPQGSPSATATQAYTAVRAQTVPQSSGSTTVGTPAGPAPSWVPQAPATRSRPQLRDVTTVRVQQPQASPQRLPLQSSPSHGPVA